MREYGLDGCPADMGWWIKYEVVHGEHVGIICKGHSEYVMGTPASAQSVYGRLVRLEAI